MGAREHLVLLRQSEKGLQDKVTVIGTTSPNQAAQFLEDGSMDYSILWDPGEAGYVMVYLAKLILEGNLLKLSME